METVALIVFVVGLLAIVSNARNVPNSELYAGDYEISVCERTHTEHTQEE